MCARCAHLAQLLWYASRGASSEAGPALLS
jgi:hypothetical protein